MRFDGGNELQHALADHVVHSRLALEAAVHFDEAVIDGLLLSVEEDFDDAVALIHGVEEGTVTLLSIAEPPRHA